MRVFLIIRQLSLPCVFRAVTITSCAVPPSAVAMPTCARSGNESLTSVVVTQSSDSTAPLENAGVGASRCACAVPAEMYTA